MTEKREQHESQPETGLPIVGNRRQFYFNDAGQPAYRVTELTADDFLNPQPDDIFEHGAHHAESVRQLAGMLRHHYRYSPTASVQIQSKIVWRDATLAQPMPDVAIVNNLRDTQTNRPLLDLAAEQSSAEGDSEVTVRAIFEVTSPLLASYDLEQKRALYERANVLEYWILDSGLRPDNDQVRFEITGYRLHNDHYEAIAPSGELRWESKICRVWLGLSADRQSFQLGDLRTGKALPLPADDENPMLSAQAEANRRAQSIAGQLNL